MARSTTTIFQESVLALTWHEAAKCVQASHDFAHSYCWFYPLASLLRLAAKRAQRFLRLC
eukprot:4368987-Amphidinium_carterae.1